MPKIFIAIFVALSFLGISSWHIVRHALIFHQFPANNGSYTIKSTTLPIKDPARVEPHEKNANQLREWLITIWYPIDKSQSNKKFPIIFFSPGYGVAPNKYSVILQNLASHGFVVVGMNHTYMNGKCYLSRWPYNTGYIYTN